PSIVTTTSAMTAPSVTALTVPDSWLRALSFMLRLLHDIGSASRYASNVEDPTPTEEPHRDQHAERGEHQDRRRGDRLVEVTALELAVHDEGQRLGPALDVAREHDRRPELAERASPG